MSPRTPEQFEAIRQQRTEDIINAALRLFARKGFNATSITSIAREADIAKGLLYNYFESKEHLLEEVIEEGFRSCLPPMDELGVATESPKQIFRAMLETMKDSIKTNPEFWQLYARMFMQMSQNERVEKIIMKYTQTYFGQIRDLLAGLDIDNPDIETWKLGAQLDGVLLHYVLLYEKARSTNSNAPTPGDETWPEYPLDEVIESIIQQYTH